LNQGINLFAGASLPPDLMPTLRNLFGPFPDEKSLDPTRIDWSTTVLIESLWKEAVPDFSFVWMNEPDLSNIKRVPVRRAVLPPCGMPIKTWRGYCAHWR